MPIQKSGKEAPCDDAAGQSAQQDWPNEMQAIEMSNSGVGGSVEKTEWKLERKQEFFE
jgi:hypothetical protein